MHIGDRELAQLKKYAQGLGIVVTVKLATNQSAAEGVDAEWDITGKQIILYVYPKETKTAMILKLLHELGHHLEFVYRGRQHPKELDTALGLTPPVPKKYRKAIYENEVRSAVYHTIIANEVGLKLPLWKIEVERDHQLECYKYYYLMGKELTIKKKNEIHKKLIAKYRK